MNSLRPWLPFMNPPAESTYPGGMAPAEAIDQIVRRARALYSLPVVAAEVLQLTSNPRVDIRALKECIENDPALTAKLLRVVNSSLFGLSREVGDLNQAIALLGIKPLKLLVLGFSLPDNLFCEVASEQLQWYWKTTIARAVAARELCEQLWKQPGDDAFLAGLLQDIGVLVLLGELREPYAQFLESVIDRRVDVHQLEVNSLGFDHTTLSARLLEHWNMPELLVRSIAKPRIIERLRKEDSPSGRLAQVLHLAELLAQLVGQNRLSTLPELLEAGEAYCQLDKERLHRLVATLQPKVRQLVEVLSLDLPESPDYSQTLIDAHAQMSLIAESVVPPLSNVASVNDSLCDAVLADAENLRAAVGRFLEPKAETTPTAATLRYDGPLQKPSQQPVQQTASGQSGEAPSAKPQAAMQDFTNRLTLTVGECRARRRGLSVILLEARRGDLGNAGAEEFISHALDAVCGSVDHADCFFENLATARRVLVLPDCERREAVTLARAMLAQLRSFVEKQNETSETIPWNFCAGVASVSIPTKNFLPASLLETAGRCLNAAGQSAGGAVKSLEIY